jgi:DNA-binding CsgD family transcriptional regulator
LLHRDIDEEAILDALDEAVNAQILEEVPNEYGRYRFNHALTQQTLKEELSITRRARLHAKIAEAIESMYGDSPLDHALELVEHFANAETVLGTKRLTPYLLAAGEQLLKNFSHEQAMEYFLRGIEAKQDVPLDEETADMHVGLAKAQIAMSDPSAEQNMYRAFEYYESSSNVDKMIELAIHPFPYIGSNWAESSWVEPVLNRCLELVGKDKIAARYLEVARISAMFWQEVGYEEARKKLIGAIKTAQAHQDFNLELRSLSCWASIAALDHRNDEAINISEKALSLARLHQDHFAELMSLHSISNAFRQIGDPRQHVYIAQTVPVAEKLRNRNAMLAAYLNVARLAFGRGEFATVKRFCDLSADLGEKTISSVWRDYIAIETGKFETAFQSLSRVMSEQKHQSTVSIKMMMTCAIAAKTRDRRIIELARSSYSDVSRNEAVPADLASRNLQAKIRFAIATGAREEAKKYYLERNEAFAAAYGIGGSDNHLGPLAHTAGFLDEAISHFEFSQKKLEYAQHALFAAWNAFWWGETLVERGSDGDVKKARTLLNDTIKVAAKLGMVLVEGRSHQLLELLDESSSASQIKIHSDGLSKREIEVLIQISRGMTNKEIGEKLFISVKTVNTHVEHIFEKTGMANRAEASAYAVRHRLGDTDQP